jgi:hypothetical protein
MLVCGSEQGHAPDPKSLAALGSGDARRECPKNVVAIYDRLNSGNKGIYINASEKGDRSRWKNRPAYTAYPG